MSVETILFFVLAVAALGGAVNLIAQTHPIHSALSLIVVMVALAGIYLLLGAELLAAVQIIVYAGAIMVLFVFTIMLLNAGAEERTAISRAATWVGLPFAAILTVVLGWRLATSPAPVYSGPGVELVRASRQLSELLFTSYVFPFELTSILILVAILGAVVLAKRDF
ncbi:MAG TPA: NADH-quinone oxidoreductase subunit J [Candidatus Acidoferrales bacterium]|nr:NADH-quinone oxidoreductase subunit J [Candidatus Acidoferrales bacterium]